MRFTVIIVRKTQLFTFIFDNVFTKSAWKIIFKNLTNLQNFVKFFSYEVFFLSLLTYEIVYNGYFMVCVDPIEINFTTSFKYVIKFTMIYKNFFICLINNIVQ